MEVVDPGHVYSLKHFDTKQAKTVPFNILTFVKREGDKYPGNVGHHPGTTTQEVLRVLIDRIKYVDNQLPCKENERVLYYLRLSLTYLERRASRIRGKTIYPVVDGVENISICDTCGHILCTEKHDNQKEEIKDNTT